MNKIAIVLFCLVSFISAKAQKDFEGKIIYTLHSGAEEKGDDELTMLFGKNKLKFISKEKNDTTNHTYSILNIDSGKIYTVNISDSTYTVKLLKTKKNLHAPSKKTIAGYSTTPLTDDSRMSLFGGYMAQSSTILYPADSLTYTVPDNLKNAMEFIFIEKNKIVLGAEAYIDYSGMVSDADTTDKTVYISAFAKEIKPMQIPASEFEIPANFMDSRDKYATIEPVEDSLTARMYRSPDSLMRAPEKHASKKGTKKPITPKKTSSLKSSAINRKP